MSLVFFAFGFVSVIAFELVMVNSPYYDENACHRQSAVNKNILINFIYLFIYLFIYSFKLYYKENFPELINTM